MSIFSKLRLGRSIRTKLLFLVPLDNSHPVGRVGVHWLSDDHE